MIRALLYVVIAALALFVVAAVFLLDTGGGSSGSLPQVSVHDLSANVSLYRGQRVTTEGVLRRVAEPEEHFLVTAEELGIVVKGYSVEELRRLEGKPVTVTGRFSFDAEEGVYIAAESVTGLQ